MKKRGTQLTIGQRSKLCNCIAFADRGKRCSWGDKRVAAALERRGFVRREWLQGRFCMIPTDAGREALAQLQEKSHLERRDAVEKA